MLQSIASKKSDMTEQLNKKSVKAAPTTHVCRHQVPPSFCGRSNHDYRKRTPLTDGSGSKMVPEDADIQIA